MDCDCASMHLLFAQKLAEGLDGVQHIFTATHCVKCGKYIRSWSERDWSSEQIAEGMMYSVVKVRKFPWDSAIDNLMAKDLSKDNLAQRILGPGATYMEQLGMTRAQWESVAVCLRNHIGAAGNVVHAREILFELIFPGAVLRRFFPTPAKKPWWKFW